MTARFEESKRSGHHAFLPRLAGRWKGLARTYFEPGKLADEAPIEGTIRVVLDGRFVVHEYEGGMTGFPMAGVSIHGFDLQSGRWQTANIDSAHNGTRILFQEGKPGGAPDRPDAFGTYPAPEGPDWGWRTTLELSEDDRRLTMIHYNVTPAGEEAVGVEIVYHRA